MIFFEGDEKFCILRENPRLKCPCNIDFFLEKQSREILYGSRKENFRALLEQHIEEFSVRERGREKRGREGEREVRRDGGREGGGKCGREGG